MHTTFFAPSKAPGSPIHPLAMRLPPRGAPRCRPFRPGKKYMAGLTQINPGSTTREVGIFSLGKGYRGLGPWYDGVGRTK